MNLLKCATLTFVFSIFVSSYLLSSTIICPDFSKCYKNSDHVILAKVKTSGFKGDFDLKDFYKGRLNESSKVFYPLQNEVCSPKRERYEKSNYYILFVEQDSLFSVHKIGLSIDTILWKSFFNELAYMYEQSNPEERHRIYSNWLLKYLAVECFESIITEELDQGNGYLFSSSLLCKDTMHFQVGDHLDCKLPSLFNQKQQYELFQFLNEEQRFLKHGLFIWRLDSITKTDFQCFFYANFKMFYNQNIKENNGSGFPKKESKWGGFLNLFRRETTDNKLRDILFAYLNTPDILHQNKAYLKNKENILFKLKKYIWKNNLMFSPL